MIARLCDAVQSLARVDNCHDFPTARKQLQAQPYDWLVTNIRLGSHNGLHLAYLVMAGQLQTRVLVYGDRPDMALAREASDAGAFFESRECVHRTLAAYLAATLPPKDRRDHEKADRRTVNRGGRRCVDQSPTGQPA